MVTTEGTAAASTVVASGEFTLAQVLDLHLPAEYVPYSTDSAAATQAMTDQELKDLIAAIENNTANTIPSLAIDSADTVDFLAISGTQSYLDTVAESLDTRATSMAHAAYYEQRVAANYEMELLDGSYPSSYYLSSQYFNQRFPKVDLGSDQNLYGNLKDDLNNRIVEGLNFYSSHYPANSSYDKSFGAMYSDWNLGLGPEALYASDGTLFNLDTTEIYASDGSLNNLEIIESIASLIYTSNATITSIKAEFGSDPFAVAVTTVAQNGVSVAYIAAVAAAPDIFFVSYTYSYPSSEINLIGNLAYLNLSEADLSGIDFKGADLSGTFLSGSNLIGADLSGANLNGAYLNGADLSSADLTDTNLWGVFSGQIIGQPSLPDGYSIMNGYIVGPNVDLTGADLTGVDLSGVDLSGAIVSNANLTATNFSSANGDVRYSLGTAPDGIGETIFGNDGDEVLIGSSGHDQVYSGGGDDDISTFDGTDTIVKDGTGNAQIDAGKGGDRVIINGSGNVNIDAGEGDDRIIINGPGNVNIDAGDGHDEVRINSHGDITVSMGSGHAGIIIGAEATGHVRIDTDASDEDYDFLHFTDPTGQYSDIVGNPNNSSGFNYVKSADGTNGTMVLEDINEVRGGVITVEVENQLEYDTNVGKWVMSGEGFKSIWAYGLRASLVLGSDFEEGDALFSNGYFPHHEVMVGGKGADVFTLLGGKDQAATTTVFGDKYDLNADDGFGNSNFSFDDTAHLAWNKTDVDINELDGFKFAYEVVNKDTDQVVELYDVEHLYFADTVAPLKIGDAPFMTSSGWHGVAQGKEIDFKNDDVSFKIIGDTITVSANVTETKTITEDETKDVIVSHQDVVIWEGNLKDISSFGFADQTVKIVNRGIKDFLTQKPQTHVFTDDAEIVLSKIDCDIIVSGGGADAIYLSSDVTWSSFYSALNIETQANVSLTGKTKFSTVIDGQEDEDTLNLTDSAAGDAFFLHDSYSGIHDSLTAVDDGMGRTTVARAISLETINAGAGDDVIDLTSPTFDMGGIGMTINGEAGNDTIWAAEGDDELYGGDDDDILFGGEGNDILTGGSGADIFEFKSSGTVQTDSITDYTAEDTLKFYLQSGDSEVSSANLSGGNLSWGNLTIDFGDTSITNFDDLNIAYDYI